MKKHLTLLPFAFITISCAEVQSFVSTSSSSQMPTYEFYEKYAGTDNADAVIPLFRQNLTILDNKDGKQQVFNFSPSLVNKATFSFYDPDVAWNFTNVVYPNIEIAKDKVRKVSLSFSSVLNFTQSNFYKIFNLNPNDIKIIQLKQHCSDYRRTVPLYKITVKNGNQLYVIEESGSGSASSQTSINLFRKLPSCKNLGYEKTIKQYGNNSFNE